jgi:hypothetical protein
LRDYNFDKAKLYEEVINNVQPDETALRVDCQITKLRTDAKANKMLFCKV